MNKPVVGYDNFNLPITKQCIEALSEQINKLSYFYLNRTDMPQSWSNEVNDIGIIISGMRPYQDIPGNLTTWGLIYFKGEILPFKSGNPEASFTIVDNAVTVEGTDLNGIAYKGTYNNKYCQYDAAGAYSMNILVRAEIADRKSLFALSYPNMSMTYLNANFTRESPNQNKSVFVVDQFGKLINNQIIKAVDYVSGATDIELMTLPAQYRPKVPSGLDRMYFTAYLKRVGQSPVRTYPLSMYIIPTTGVIYLQTEGNSFNVNGDDLIYINIEYYVS